MADLLGSILGKMEKPPSISNEERKKAKAQQKQLEKLQQRKRENLNMFKLKTQKDVELFIKDSQKQKLKFGLMEKVYRAIIHDVAEVAGLASFSFGEEGVDRYIMLWKKEFAPSDDELAAYRRGEEWSEEIAQELAENRAISAAELAQEAVTTPSQKPASNYRDKYQHLIGKEAGKQAANVTTTNKNYGFVPSENKRDLRTIEEVLAESKAKKKQKIKHSE